MFSNKQRATAGGSTGETSSGFRGRKKTFASDQKAQNCGEVRAYQNCQDEQGPAVLQGASLPFTLSSPPHMSQHLFSSITKNVFGVYHSHLAEQTGRSCRVVRDSLEIRFVDTVNCASQG